MMDKIQDKSHYSPTYSVWYIFYFISFEGVLHREYKASHKRDTEDPTKEIKGSQTRIKSIPTYNNDSKT